MLVGGRGFNGVSTSITDIIYPIFLFTLCSLTEGITIGCALINMNEHLATKAIKLTLCAVAITMSLTCIFGMDFSFLAPIIFVALIILLILQIIRIFKSFSKKSERNISILGIIVFIVYLLIDFSNIVNNEQVYSKDWGTALSFAIDIYLDIINLFLYILDLLGD